jgi:transposase
MIRTSKHILKFANKNKIDLLEKIYKVLNKLSMMSDESGINFIKVDPAYTSQTCSKCGSIHKESRKGEKFLCVDCGYSIDADYNASINILHRGIYSSSTKKSNLCYSQGL